MKEGKRKHGELGITTDLKETDSKDNLSLILRDGLIQDKQDL